jgi:hypothetical protein
MTELDKFLELDVIQWAELLTLPGQIPLNWMLAFGHSRPHSSMSGPDSEAPTPNLPQIARARTSA